VKRCSYFHSRARIKISLVILDALSSSVQPLCVKCKSFCFFNILIHRVVLSHQASCLLAKLNKQNSITDRNAWMPKKTKKREKFLCLKICRIGLFFLRACLFSGFKLFCICLSLEKLVNGKHFPVNGKFSLIFRKVFSWKIWAENTFRKLWKI